MMDYFSPTSKWIVPKILIFAHLCLYGHVRQKFLTWEKSLSHIHKGGRKDVSGMP